MAKLLLYYIEFRNAEGKFFTSRYARFARIADLHFDLHSYFKRFPGHTATWKIIED